MGCNELKKVPPWRSSAEVFQFVISDAGPEGKFVLDLKNGSGSAQAGEAASAAGVLLFTPLQLLAVGE